MITNVKPSSLIEFNKITREIKTPTLQLKTRGGKFIGIIKYDNLSVSLVGKGLDEISFDIHKEVNGEECKFWDKLHDLCIINWVGYGQFEADITDNDADETIKNVHCYSLETELGQRTIRDLHINDEEALTIPLQSDLDTNGNFIPTVLYDKNDPKHSLLDRVINAKTPHWSIEYVSPLFVIDGKVYEPNIIQRTFTIDKTTPYEFFDNELCKEISCIFTYDTYKRTVSCWNLDDAVYEIKTRNVIEGAYAVKTNESYLFYDKNNILLENQDDYAYCEGIGEDTDILITKKKLANSLTINSDKDSIKNCFYVSGGDDVITNTVAAANVTGNNYIYLFDNFQYDDMSDELVDKIQSYSDMLEERKEYFYKDGGVYLPHPDYTYDSETQTCRDTNNKVLPTAIYKDGMVYVCDTCSYVLNGVGYNADDEPLDDYIYIEPGLYTKYCQTQDRYYYLNDNKFPSTTLSETTAQEEWDKIYKYFNENDNVVVIQNSATNTAFSHITSTVENLIGAICDTRYDIKIMNTEEYPQTFTGCNKANPDGIWTGYLQLQRTTDETDYYLSQLQVTVRYTLDIMDSVDFAKQKLNLSIAKMSIADLDFSSIDDLQINNEEKFNKYKEFFMRYNLTSLNSYVDAFQSCLDLLEDLYAKLNMDETIVSTAYLESKKIFTMRKDSCIEVRNEVKDKVNDISSQITDLNNKIIEFRASLDLEKYIGDDELWFEYQSYIREDEYMNNNYKSDGLTDAELLVKSKELLEVAEKELQSACVIQKTISGDLNNIFAIEELEKLYDSFAMFNYIRIESDNKVYKLRIVQIDFNFGNPEKINTTFSEQIENVYNNVSDLESVTKKTNSISSSYNSVTKQAKQGSEANNTIVELHNDGIDSDEYILRNGNNEVVINRSTILLRQMSDPGIYDPQQIKLTPTGIKMTQNKWEDSFDVVGLVRKEDGTYEYRVNADSIKVDKLSSISSNLGDITAGSININDNLIIDENGKTTIKEGSISFGAIDDANNNITKITKDTVTTEYVNALNIKAGSVDAENITGETISGKVITGSEISGGSINGTTISGSELIATGKHTSSNGVEYVSTLECKKGYLRCEDSNKQYIAILSPELIRLGGINSSGDYKPLSMMATISKYYNNLTTSDIPYGQISCGTADNIDCFYVRGDSGFIHTDGRINVGNSVYPVTDGDISLGFSGNRWGTIYSSSPSISTSDREEKKDIEDIPNVEEFVMGLNPKRFKYINGESDRYHYGMISQDVEELMKSMNMKDTDFAGFCKDKKEYVDKDGCLIKEKGYRYGLRYEEFIAPLIKMVQIQEEKIKQMEIEIQNLKKEAKYE